MEKSITRKTGLFAILLALVMMVSVFAVPDNVSAASNYPTKVTGVKATATGFDSVKVSWTKKSGVTGYKVYRSTSKSSGYKLVKTITKRQTNYWNNTGLTTNKTYYYKVKAYKKKSGKVYNSKQYSIVKSARPQLTKPATVTVASNKYKSVKLTWTKGKNAKGYKIYRSTSKSSGYKLVKTTSNRYWTDTTISPNKTYYYKIKSYNSRNNKTQYSYFTSYKTVKTKPATPSGITATTADFSIDLSWNKVTGATKYQVYRSDGEKFTVDTNYFSDSTVVPGTKYRYKIRAYGIAYGAYSTYTDYIKSKEADPSEIAYLEYNKDGNTEDTTRIYIGQKWTDELNASLNGGEPVEKLLSRNNEQWYEGGRQDTYCFDTEDYDNFLIVYVKNNKINAWQTTANSLGVYKGTEIIHGTYSSDYEEYDLWMESTGEAPYILEAEVVASKVKIGQIYFGGIVGDLQTWDTRWSEDLEAEEKLFEMTVNAYRVMNDRPILEHNEYFYGDGETYGAKAWSKTMAACNTVTHDVLPEGPLAGISDRSILVSKASNAAGSKVLYFGENVSNEESGEFAADGFYRSPLHSQTLMLDIEPDGYERTGIHAAATYPGEYSLYWTWNVGSVKIDYGVYPPSYINVDEITSTTATLSWEDVVAGKDNAYKYIVTIYTDADCTNIYRTSDVTAPPYKRTGLQPDTTYYVRVKSRLTIDGKPRASEYSEVVKFKTEPES